MPDNPHEPQILSDECSMMRLDTRKSQRTSIEVEEERPMPALAPQCTLLPGESADIKVDVHRLLRNADEWLKTPNTNYDGRAPVELIGTKEEFLLRQTLRSALYSGMA